MGIEAIIFLVVAFVFGAFVGSFLNVCIHRLPRNESILHPSSRCYACGTRVQWYDNLPIIAWLALRGRCRWCGTSFSSRYLWSEIAVGALTAATWWYACYGGFPVLRDGVWQASFAPAMGWISIGMPVPVAMGLAFGCLLPLVWLGYVASMIDHDHEIIPDELTIPFQFVAPFLAAGALTPLALESKPWPAHWLVIESMGVSRVDPATFLIHAWLIIGGALAFLALTLVAFRWIYGARLGHEAWDEGSHRAIRTGLWWFIGCTLVQLAVCSALALLIEPGAKASWLGLFPVLLAQSILGSIAGWAIPWLVGLLGSLGFRKNAMGQGDVKFLAPVGAFLGPLGVLYTFFAAAIVGTAIGVPKLIITGSRRLRFGPCLALGALVVLAVGGIIHQWFSSRILAAWAGSGT